MTGAEGALKVAIFDHDHRGIRRSFVMTAHLDNVSDQVRRRLGRGTAATERLGPSEVVALALKVAA